MFRKIYRLSQGDSSLAFLGLTVGCLLAAPTASIMAKYYMKRRIARNNVGLPEDRLPWALGAAVAAPIGMFWFAWTGKEEIHYIVPILGGVPYVSHSFMSRTYENLMTLWPL